MFIFMNKMSREAGGEYTHRTMMMMMMMMKVQDLLDSQFWESCIAYNNTFTNETFNQQQNTSVQQSRGSNANQ